jgi:GNAT superfamily N-acetyltransferase
MAWRSGPHSVMVRVRRTRPTDIGELHAFAGRCSSETLFRRFHGAAEHAVRRELERVATSTPLHRSWVAVTERSGMDPDAHAIHGSATLAWGVGDVVEAAFLVEDAWFRRGIGRRLFQALAIEAEASGVDAVRATIQPDNRRAVRFVTAVAPAARMAFADGLLEATIPIIGPRDRRSGGTAAIVGARYELG